MADLITDSSGTNANNTIVGPMRAMARWSDPATLQQFAAEQLHSGSLSLVLGAGVSFSCGLPRWTELVNRAYRMAGQSRPTDRDDSAAADFLLTHVCKGNDERFMNHVRAALYDGIDVSPARLAQHQLLAALSALTATSARGSAVRVVSFNFDDLLEQFLGYFGVVVRSVGDLPAWHVRADVHVYHPHGYLPLDPQRGTSRGIVMTSAQFDRVVGNAKSHWRNLLLDVFRSTTPLFVGLSGRDPNLRQLLLETKEAHACCSRHDAFWGIRFTDDPHDPDMDTWMSRGVYVCVVPNFEKLPSWLLRVCQSAASRTSSGIEQ